MKTTMDKKDTMVIGTRIGRISTTVKDIGVKKGKESNSTKKLH